MSAPHLEIRLRLPLAHFVLDVDVASSARTLGVFGPSGAGKSSLVEAVAGWRAPETGRIRLGETVLYDSSQGTSLAIEERGIGYVPQDALLFPHWNVGRNVRGGAKGRGVEEEQRAVVERTAAMLEIAHLLERSSTQLSGGERQRVALARALASRPRFLLFDEPLGSLDLPLRRRILPYLIRVRDRVGLPTLYVSHDPTEVQALCDEVVVLEAGRVRAQGVPSEVLRHVRSSERAFENVLTGRVSAIEGDTALVRVDRGGTARVPAAGHGVGDGAVFAVGSDEILVALDAPTRISARNVLPAQIERLEAAPTGEVRVDALLERGSGARLSASLTRAARDELGLREGQSVYLVFKTNSCRVLSAPASTTS